MNDRLGLAQEDEKRKKKVRCFLYIDISTSQLYF